MSEGVRIERGAAADVERLEALWLAMRQAHREAMPELAPYTEDGPSGAARRAHHEGLMSEAESLSISLNERRGYRPTLLHLSRFAGRR